VKAFLFGLVALLAAVPATAQMVGHDPASSPYLDLEHKQEISLLFGYLSARHDPAGVAPGSAPMIGARYEINLVGPLGLSADLTRSSSSHTVLNPFLPTATRVVGTTSSPVYSADLALVLDLTGRKSWHHIVPQLRGGLGVVSSSARDDSTGFAFGTPFAFTFGGGLKFEPGGRWGLRADITDRVFKLSYPTSYYTLAADNTSVLPASTPNSFYTHQAALTVGVSYLFGR
jgi:hypothetical protein